MPVSVRIVAARRRVEVTASGLLTGEEMRAAQIEIAESPGFEPGFDALFDLSAVSEVQMSAESVKEVAAKTIFAHNVRRAFVTRQSVAFGMMRMLGAYLGDRGGEVEMFQDRVAAERWLDRHPVGPS
jgi:hypothetical protein